MASTTTTKRPLSFYGDEVSFNAGKVVVILTWVRDQTYRVALHHAGPLGPCGLIDAVSYPDEQVARAEAVRMCRAYWLDKSVEQVAADYEQAQDILEKLGHTYHNVTRERARWAWWAVEALKPLDAAKRQYDLINRPLVAA